MSTSKSNLRNIVWENAKAVLWAVFLAIIIKTSVVEANKVPTGSMEDTILIGDCLMANKFIYGAKIPFTDYRLPSIREPQTGDIVVFDFPYAKDTSYIKRCIAGPGQTVEVIDKVVFVDGVKIDLVKSGKITTPIAYRALSGKNTPDNFGPYLVPEDNYFMMGDNRDRSYDSRYWGPVHKDYIRGKAMFLFWSWKDDPNEPAISISDPLSPPRQWAYNTVHFIERVRWSRLLNFLE